MNFLKKPNSKTKIGLVFIGISLFAITGILAVKNYFNQQTKIELKICTDFNGFGLDVQQHTINQKSLIPSEFPNLLPQIYTNEAINIFTVKLKNKNDKIKEMFLKTELSQELKNFEKNDNNFISSISIDHEDYDQNRKILKMESNKSYDIVVKTKQKDFLDEGISNPELHVVIDYKLVNNDLQPYTT